MFPLRRQGRGRRYYHNDIWLLFVVSIVWVSLLNLRNHTVNASTPGDGRPPPPPPPRRRSRTSGSDQQQPVDEYYYEDRHTRRRPPPPRPQSSSSSSSSSMENTVMDPRYHPEDTSYPYEYGYENDVDIPLPPLDDSTYYPDPSFRDGSIRETSRPPLPPRQGQMPVDDSYYPADGKVESSTRLSSSSSSSSPPKVPIHYEFPMAGTTMTSTTTTASSDGSMTSSSPRNDLVTRYMSTKRGKIQLHVSSMIIGGSLGMVLAKTILPFGTTVWGSIGAGLWLISGLLFRTPWGELVRATALSVLLVVQRTRQIRQQYPTWRYLPGALFRYDQNNRRSRRLPPPFPLARNPWRYAPRRPDDVDFNMLYSIMAMAFVGSTCGGNMPMIPTWLGSLVGAATFALGCTLTPSPRGDLCRTMGMRVVAMVQELWDIQQQLGIVPKAAVVSSQVIDRLMVLDRQHKVKDRFLTVVNAGYEQVVKTASKVQEQRMDAQGRQRTAMDLEDEEKEKDLYDNRRPSRNPRGRSPPPPRSRRRRSSPPPKEMMMEEEDGFRDRPPPRRNPSTPPPRRNVDDDDESDRRRRPRGPPPMAQDDMGFPQRPPVDDAYDNDDDYYDYDDRRGASPPPLPKRRRGWFGR